MNFSQITVSIKFSLLAVSILAPLALGACSQKNSLGGVLSQGSTGSGSNSTSSTASPGSSPGSTTPPGSGSAGMTGLHTVNGTGGVGGTLVNGSGKVVQLHGADETGTEYACVGGGGGKTGYGFFDGTANTASGIAAMKAWNINAVRVPLNEDCWLGINTTNPTVYGGQAYINAIQTYVNSLTAAGFAVILDLHWASPGTIVANQQVSMPDTDHAVAFWKSVAATFASKGSTDTSANSQIIFDLFNEPLNCSSAVGATPTAADWACWLNGGASCKIVNQSNVVLSTGNVAGMSTLLQAVRGTGAQNVVMMGGLAYSSLFQSWVSSVTSITAVSTANVAASWHIYDFNNTGCPSQYNKNTSVNDCYSTTQLTSSSVTDISSVLAAGFPVVAGETGAAESVNYPWWTNMFSYFTSQNIGFLGWAWTTDSGEDLITNYSTGTASPEGAVLQSYLGKF